MAKDKQVERCHLIIQYNTYIETINIESQDIDKAILASLKKKPGQVLSIILNGSIIYERNR